MQALVEKIFSAEGPLRLAICNYEMRKEQVEMSQEILRAYKDKQILLIEAATGVGKSWAYLIPAILYAVKHNETTVISTHTIALQEQLVRKDLPFLLRVLGVDLQVTVVKGMGNYFCRKKHEERILERDLLAPEEQREVDQWEEFSKTAIEGSNAEVRFPLYEGAWDKVAADHISCIRNDCPHFSTCFLFRARKQAQESRLLVVNHHLLLANLSARLRPDFEEDHSVLPSHKCIILDEAHHLENVALDSFAQKIDRLDLVRFLGRIHSEHQPTKSRIGVLRSFLASKWRVIPPSLLSLLDIEIPVQKRLVTTFVEALFDSIEAFCDEEFASVDIEEYRFRLRPMHQESSKWQERIEIFQQCQREWDKLSSLLSLVKQEILRAGTKDLDACTPYLASLNNVQAIIDWKIALLKEFVFPTQEEHRIRLVQMPTPSSRMMNVTLIDATLNVATYLRDLLFAKTHTVVLCSATLASHRDFSFIKQQIGIEELITRVQERIYASPFDYQKQARFFVPLDFPYPHEEGFLLESILFLREIIIASKGGCFFLFTSYEMLQACYFAIIQAKDRPSATYMKQGDMARALLLEEFKTKDDAVLFATSSFWEGVDVAGKALRCVVLVKIPFKTPSDPLFQAISEKLEIEGKDPFTAYALPLALLQFKQGFGRLIRTEKDHGCVICLDKRVMTKRYGAILRQGLPSCPMGFLLRKEIVMRMQQFYAAST